MGNTTGIQWAEATWNPWMGCHKVSQGCKNCYMYREQRQYGHDPDVVVKSKTRFADPLTWMKTGKVKPGSRVFVCSWSDFFIEEADVIRAQAWDIMRKANQFMYLIPTKRVERVRECLPDDWGDGWPHVMILASVEDQAMLEKRLPLLLNVPARWRGLSVEPMLGPINLVDALAEINYNQLGRRELNWVICGGESGPECRAMDPEWAKALMMDCYLLNIPFFMKQMGGWPHKGGEWTDLPEALRVREFPFPNNWLSEDQQNG